MKFLSDRTSNDKGFSLVEALIIIAIIAVVGGLGVFAYARHGAKAHASGWQTIYSNARDDLLINAVDLPTVQACRTTISSTSSLVKVRMTKQVGSHITHFYIKGRYLIPSNTYTATGYGSSFSSTRVSTASTSYATTSTKKIYEIEVWQQVGTERYQLFGTFGVNSYGPLPYVGTICSAGV